MEIPEINITKIENTDLQETIWDKLNSQIKEKFYELLEVKKPPKYKVRVNTKYAAVMDRYFWSMVIFCYKDVVFESLEDDILYELREEN